MTNRNPVLNGFVSTVAFWAPAGPDRAGRTQRAFAVASGQSRAPRLRTIVFALPEEAELQNGYTGTVPCGCGFV